MAAQNRRRNKRADCVVPVEGKTGSPFENIKTLDFSKGGFGFISPKKLSVNQEIPIEIELAKDKDTVVVMGRVQWVRPARTPGADLYRIGISFQDVLHGSKSRLNSYFQKTR